MLNAIVNVIKEAVGRNKDHLRTASLKVDFYILPNTQKAVDFHLNFRMMTEGNGIGRLDPQK